MATNVIFYKTSDDSRVLDKTLTDGRTVSCNIYGTCDILSPTLLLSYDASLVNYNYAHIPSWGRYYFVGKPTVENGARMIVPLNVDVLMSHNAGIKALNVNVVRNQNDKNAYLYDSEYAMKVTRECKTIGFSKSPFFDTYNGNQVNYLLTVIGGGSL